jgi:hypothetical protein
MMDASADDCGRARRQAIRALIDWIDSDATTKALDAIALLELSDEDIAVIFMGDARVTRIPFLGRIN